MRAKKKYQIMMEIRDYNVYKWDKGALNRTLDTMLSDNFRVEQFLNCKKRFHEYQDQKL